jgi:hypothetical protein
MYLVQGVLPKLAALEDFDRRYQVYFPKRAV